MRRHRHAGSQRGALMNVNICGITHEIIECEDSFTANATHFGEIDYKACKIRIKKTIS